MEITLIRKYYSRGCNGLLLVNKRKLCYTIELPWKDNQRQVSCIPEGRYQLTKRHSARFGNHLLVNNVKGRTYILIHAFNNALQESQGCIAPVGILTGHGIGLSSRASLKKLLDMVYPEIEKGKQVFLTIQNN